MHGKSLVYSRAINNICNVAIYSQTTKRGALYTPYTPKALIYFKGMFGDTRGGEITTQISAPWSAIIDRLPIILPCTLDEYFWTARHSRRT